jgi:hypothetical protein
MTLARFEAILLLWRESIVFQPMREGIPSEYAFRARWSHFSVSLTSPSGRKYIAGVVKLGDSSVGAGICRIRRVPGKANSYPSDILDELKLDNGKKYAVFIDRKRRKNAGEPVVDGATVEIFSLVGGG